MSPDERGWGGGCGRKCPATSFKCPRMRRRGKSCNFRLMGGCRVFDCRPSQKLSQKKKKKVSTGRRVRDAWASDCGSGAAESACLSDLLQLKTVAGLLQRSLAVYIHASVFEKKKLKNNFPDAFEILLARNPSTFLLILQDKGGMGAAVLVRDSR